MMMTERTRALLNQIDAFLAEGDGDGMDLATVLAAVRGPDNDDRDLKHKTTVVIRTAAFPLTAAKAKKNPFALAWVFNQNDKTIQVPVDTTYHFRNHIRSAARALDVIVNEL